MAGDRWHNCEHMTRTVSSRGMHDVLVSAVEGPAKHGMPAVPTSAISGSKSCVIHLDHTMHLLQLHQPAPLPQPGPRRATACPVPVDLPWSRCSLHGPAAALRGSDTCHGHRPAVLQPCRAVLEEGSTTVEDAPPPKAGADRVTQDVWQWGEFKIRYQKSGNKGPPLVLVHGFGGNADHWRKNTPVLGEHCRTYAIDLLGYGYSDKPDPRAYPDRTLYTFQNWARQLRDFIDQVVQEPVFLSTNSVGGLAALQLAIDHPDKVRGVQLIDISLRMLHIRNQAPWKKPFVRGLQSTLRNTPIGGFFFDQVAKPRTVMNILKQAYGDNKAAVNDELVQCVLEPGLQPGAAAVFLDFISYSDGPLPDDLLAACTKPVSILWGEKDPWEPIADGRKFQRHSCVEEFIDLPGVGHCGMDEAPELVNPLVLKFVQRHS